MLSNLIVTVYHDKIDKYFPAFFKSLEAQSIDQLNVLIFDDSSSGLSLDAPNSKVNVEIIKLPALSLLENRIWIFNSLKDKEFDVIHFCDGDDTLSENYVLETSQHLNYTNMVVHDFNLMNSSGVVTERNYWSGRIADNFEFDASFIESKNIVGLGNTSIKCRLLNSLILKKADSVTIPDWFIFTQLMTELEESAKFVSNPTFNYRQHDNLGDVDNYSFNKAKGSVFHVKNHFKGLIEVGLSNKNNLLLKLEALSDDFTETLYNSFRKNIRNKHFFWWEEVFAILTYYENQNK